MTATLWKNIILPPWRSRRGQHAILCEQCIGVNDFSCLSIKRGGDSDAPGAGH